MIKIDKKICLNCLACFSACPISAIEEKDGMLKATEKCTDCRKCIVSCPTNAISKN